MRDRGAAIVWRRANFLLRRTVRTPTGSGRRPTHCRLDRADRDRKPWAWPFGGATLGRGGVRVNPARDARDGVENVVDVAPSTGERAPAFDVATDETRQEREHPAAQAGESVDLDRVEAEPLESEGAENSGEPARMQLDAAGMAEAPRVERIGEQAWASAVTGSGRRPRPAPSGALQSPPSLPGSRYRRRCRGEIPSAPSFLRTCARRTHRAFPPQSAARRKPCGVYSRCRRTS